MNCATKTILSTIGGMLAIARFADDIRKRSMES